MARPLSSGVSPRHPAGTAEEPALSWTAGPVLPVHRPDVVRPARTAGHGPNGPAVRRPAHREEKRHPMRIEIDTDRCVGAGLCVLAAEDIFDQNDDDGRVLLLVDRPGDGRGAEVRDAATLCPADAITVHED